MGEQSEENVGNEKEKQWLGEMAFSVKLCLSFMTYTLHDDKCLLRFPLVEPATNHSRGM